MASDIRIPDPVTIKKQEDEDSYLMNEQGDKRQKEIYKMEEEKLDLLLNQPPGVGDFPSSVDTIDAELNDGIKTKDNEILVTSHLEQVGNEEKCRSDPCLTSIPKEDETKMLDNEKQFHQCDHTGDAKEKEEYEAVVADETCENSIQKIDEQEALHDIKTSSPMSKVEEDIIVEKEESSNDDINVDQNVEEILDRQTFVDNNDKLQSIHEERNGSELELKKEASTKSIINILNDDIKTVTTNAEDSPCSHGILDEEDGGMKTELQVRDCAEISCDSKVEKVTETSRDTDLEKDEEPSTSNADHASDVAIPEVQNDETTTEIGISAEGKLEMLFVSEDEDEGSKQEGTLEEGVSLNRPSDEFTNQTETREESTQDNNILNEGDEAEFSKQKLDSITVERQVDLQEMTESTTNESREVEELTASATGDYTDELQNKADLEHKYLEKSTQDNNIPNEEDEAEFSEQKLDSINAERQANLQAMTESTTNESKEVEELTATATDDYIDESQNSKAVQDLEYKYFEENDPVEETTLVAVNKGLEENETETPREISETISNEGEKQITNLETFSGIEKEHIEAAYFGASKDDVPIEEDLSPSNLNEVHDSANELSVNNGNDVHLEHSLLQETKKVEDQNVDGVLDFENEQKIQEENNAMTEEEKYVDNVSEAYPNTEDTTGEIESLDKTVTSEMISEINSSNVEDEKISGFGLEEKIESSEIRVYDPEELESTEDTETSVQRSTIKDNKTEEQIAVDDAPTTESRNANEEEIVEKSYEEQDYEEATLNLSGEDENLLPNEIEKKKTYDEEGSDNIDTESIKEEALVKSKDACFSPETNEVDGSSEKEVEKLREEDSGRSILDEAGEKYVGEEVIKHDEDENEDIEISKGEIFCEIENVTGEKFITNEKNEDVETQEDVAFSEEHDVLATKEASMEESRNDSTCPTKEVVADNAIDNTTKNSERAMVAEEVAEKVLDEGKSKEEPVNFLVARESETETLSENDQIISAADKDIKQIKQKDDSGGELMQPLVIDETETEVLRQNDYNETLAVEDLEETKQTETEACFDSSVVAEKDTEQILQKDETSEEVNQLEFTNEIEEKASRDNAENETSVARDNVEQISLQEETKEELEQSLETKKNETETSCRDAEIIKLEDYTEKDLLNEATKEPEVSCRDIEITVPKEEDAEQVLLKEAANDIVQPQAPNETDTEVFSENVKEILTVEELQETKTIETEASSDSTADKDTERSLEKVETSEEVQQLQLTNEVEEQTFCDDSEEILVARQDTPQILHQDEPKKELDHSGETQKIESEEQCKDEEVIAPEEDTQLVVLKEVTKELEQSLVTNENEMDTFSGNSEIVLNEKDTKQIFQNIASVEEFEKVPETEETETEDNNPVITAKDTENLQKDETREEVKELLLTSELEAKTICDDDEKETSVAEDYVEKDCETNLQTYETKEEMAELINANEMETKVFHGDIETTLAEKDIDKNCQKNESTEEIDQYLGIKESNTEGFGDSSGIVINERNFEETLQKEVSREEIEKEAEKVCGNTEIDTVMGERGLEDPFEISESIEKFEQSIVTPEPTVKRDVDEDIITSIGGEETAKKEEIETARECHENVILDEISSIEIRSQETISEEITTKDFQKDENEAIGYKELEIEDVSSIEQKNTTGTLFSTPINETITEICEKENRDTVELKQELQLELKEQIEEQNSKEISTENIQLQEDPDTKALNEEIHIEERSENIAQNFFPESKVNEEEMQEEIQEEEKADSSVVSILSEEKISKEELEIKELSNEEGTDMGTSSINVEEERDSKSENEKDKDISLVAYEAENQIEYETDDQIHPTTINNGQEVTIEEATLHHTPDYKLTDLSTLPSKELDIETTDANDASENVTKDAAGEVIINEEVENPLKEQEIEDKLVQEADESFTQRDLSEMGSSDICAPSEVQQQRDEELHPPHDTENQIEYEADDQFHPMTIKNDQEVIIEEETLDHTPDDKVTDLSTLTSKELDTETTEVSNTTENVTINAEGEDIINEEVENPLQEQEIENKLVQEADESFTQRDPSEMVFSDICAPSEVQQQRDEELHQPPETENQIEYEAYDQVHPTTMKNDQEVIIEEATLDHTPDYKVTDPLTLTSKELDIETTEANNVTENVTTDPEGEDIINEEVENPLKEQEIENKLLQEADESFTQKDLSEMGSWDICAPSEVQQQRDEELHPPPQTENQIEYEVDDQVHLTTIKNDQEVIIEEATLDHTPDYKVTNLSTLTSEDLDIEPTEASNAIKNVTIDAEGEDIINEEVENPLKEQEIENKLIQEADESFTQRDFSEMGTLDNVQSSAPSDVQQQRDEELHAPPVIDRRSTFDSNEVANLNKEELIDFEKQHEVIDDKNYLESEEAGEDETKQILHSEKSEDIEQLPESKITETEAYAAEKDMGEGYQETEVIETARECKENVISDEIDSTKSQSRETVTEYFQKDGTDAIGYKEPETEHTSITERVNFKENTTAVLSSMSINETTTESSENENSDALKLRQELQLESEEQIEVENWNELQKDLDTKEAINEEIHVEERSENVAQNLLSESKVYEAETQEGTQEKEDASSVAITGRDLSEMGSDQKSAPSEVQNQRDPELHPPPEIDISTSETNEVANLDKIELADFQNQYEVVDDKNNLQTEELDEIICENPYEVVDGKNNLESEEAARDDSKDILRNEESEEEIEHLIETKTTVTEALVAEKDTREGLQETETSVAEKDTTQVLEHTEPCVFEKDSSTSNEMENLKKEELDFENEYEIVDDRNNIELEGETSKKEEPSEQPIDQYSIGDNRTSELNMTCTDFEETSRSIELEEPTAAVEVVSQGAGHDDSPVQFNELPTKEVFDATSTAKEAKEETIEDVDTIEIHYTEITELDTVEKNFEDDQAKETNLESNIQIEAPEALNEETSNQASNENYVTSFVSEVSDKEVKEVRKDGLITDDCKPSITNYESENSGLNVAESEEKDMVEDETVLDSTDIDNEPESEQKDITDAGTVIDFSAEERRDKDIEAVVEGKEGGEYEMEEKLGILTEDRCTKEGNENVASIESKVADQDFEEEISINDYDSPSAKFGSENSSLKTPESKEQEAETKEDQSVMEIRPEDISILCKEKEEDTTTMVVEGIDNRDYNIEETTPTKGVVEENILTRSFDFRSDDNLLESVEISSDKHQLVETETAEKVEDIVVRDEASYGNFEPEEKLNNPTEDTCIKEGNENLTASIDSKVFDEEIKEEMVSKEEISPSDFDSAFTKFESGDKTLESEEQKIQTINDQSAMEIKPEDNSILWKENDDETTTLAVESMVNQDHDIEETIPNKEIVEENILTRSFDFTSDSNLQKIVQIPSSENQFIASETSDKVEKNIVRDEASYGNFEPEATSPTQTIEEKLDATIEDTGIKEDYENLAAFPQSKVPDDEIKELTSKEEICINDYDSPSTKFERKDLSLKVVESEEQEIQAKEDQTSIDTKQEDEDIVTPTVESMDNREHDIEETTSKEVVVDENVLIRSFDSTGDNLQDSAEISSNKHEHLATETTEIVVSEETEHVMDEVHKAVAEEPFLTTSSDTLNDNDCHDSSVVLSQEHLPTASEIIEEKVSKSGIDDSPDKFNELELSKGQVEISIFVGKENDIIEQEDGYNSKDNTLDLGEEKAAIAFGEGDQGQRKEVAEIKEKGLLEEKNVEIDASSETLECDTDLVDEDQNSQSKMSEAEEDIKQENPTSVVQQILEQSQEDEITSTKMEATVTNEKVCDEIIKTDSRENNEEQVIENKSTLEELHMISSQGAVNESCEVSEDYMREINSNEKEGTIKSESEEDITSERETTITDTTQEERVMSECMEPPANISVSTAEESDEKITGEMRNDLEKMHSPSDEAMEETPSTSAKAMEADSSFETNAKVAPSLLETQKLMDNPNTSNIPFKLSAQASEYEQEVSIDDILSKSKDSEIEEKHQGIAVTSLNTTENEYEKTVEESITTENKVPNEAELEQNKFKEDHNQILNEDSNKEDVAEQINEPLKSTSEVYYQDVVKLSEVIDEGATEKEKADEHRMLEEVTKKESFTDEANNEYLKEEETEVDNEIQEKTEAITKEKESRVDMSELKGPENSADNNIMSKDIYQVKEIATEISGKKLNQTEEISEEGIKTRSVVGDVSPIVNFSPLTEPPIENEGQGRQDAKEEDREVKGHGDSSKDNLYEVKAEEFMSTDLEKVMSPKQKQSSIIENEVVDRTMADNIEQTIKSEEHEDEKREGAHVGDSGTDEEKVDKHDKDAVSDAPVIVEASKDIDVKVGHKKSHNILSGVGSKVKHSISKVKKAITGKSSHHKSESPK